MLLALARELAAETAGDGEFDPERFERDLDSREAIEAFRDDLKEARYREIGRYPTLVMQRPGGAGILIVGYRPHDVLRATLAHVAPELGAAATAGQIEGVLRAGALPSAEVEEARSRLNGCSRRLTDAVGDTRSEQEGRHDLADGAASDRARPDGR